MSKFIHKVQALGNKAAQIKAAIESVPPRVLEVREAMEATVGQFQQLRNDVQSSVHHLRADNEESLIESLREIDGNTATWREAGYALANVEMELGLPQRLIVHLEKIADVPHAMLRSLLAAQEGQRTTHAILAALIKAEELADRVNLAHLTYHKLMVYVGPVPTVRLCWDANAGERAVLATHAAPVAMTPPATAPSFASTSMFGAGSFFEQRSAPSPTLAPTGPAVTTTTPTPIPSAAPPLTGDGDKVDPLARFKKMPDLSRQRH